MKREESRKGKEKRIKGRKLILIVDIGYFNTPHFEIDCPSGEAKQNPYT